MHDAWQHRVHRVGCHPPVFIFTCTSWYLWPLLILHVIEPLGIFPGYNIPSALTCGLLSHLYSHNGIYEKLFRDAESLSFSSFKLSSIRWHIAGDHCLFFHHSWARVNYDPRKMFTSIIDFNAFEVHLKSAYFIVSWHIWNWAREFLKSKPIANLMWFIV